ncbi:MAG TPA: histidine kinase dimerization/phospho-acceptor domain-containing protein, partial [Bryobacteraceae bacterium]|nr:histidine kinase dimerization/phospho-acceptor domain-containing protein [Bryobacteraceae bacterium]
MRLQALIIAVASLSVIALASLLVQDALSQTEGTLRAAAELELTGAAEELKEQYQERATFSERPLEALPLEAQDLSLRGLSQTVLRSYKDVHGGFYIPQSESVVGAAGAADPISADELDAIRSTVQSGSSTGSFVSGGDLLIARIAPTADGRYAWALRRLIGVRDPAPNRRRWLLATLVLAAVAGVAGVVSILMRLRRGVDGVKRMLQELESDFAYRAAPVSGDFGEIYAAIGKMADRRIELESTLRRQDRLAALGKVVAGVAHEIRNPLNSIRLQLELLKRRSQKGAASGAEIDAAMGQVDRLNTMLGQLLGFGRPDVSNRSPQDVSLLAQRSVEMVGDRAQARRVELVLEAGERVQANVDGVQLEQVLTNLLLNAIQASPEGTEVTLQVGERGDAIELSVIDRGHGIPEAARDHVFDA